MKRVLTVTLLFIGALVGILSPPTTARAQVAALKKYQTSAGGALNARENEVVDNSLRDLERDLAGLAAESLAPAPAEQRQPAAVRMTNALYSPPESRARDAEAAPAAAPGDKIIASLKRSDGLTADVKVTVARSINKVKVIVRDGRGAVIGRVNTYDIPREDDTVTLPAIRLADGENTITVSDLGGNNVSQPLVVTGSYTPAPRKKRRADADNTNPNPE